MLIAVTINKEDIQAVTRNILGPLMSGTLIMMMWLPLILAAVILVTAAIGAIFPIPQIYPPSPADGPGTPP